ncbi:MAG TPA: hypothetical protein VFP00_09255, partial [Burkholderiales bacterium]|nr:hypothetical protein [Burkholderiales bacterium]
ELATSKEDLIVALRSPDTRDVAIDLIASENRIPRFLASKVYQMLASRLAAGPPHGDADDAPGATR